MIKTVSVKGMGDSGWLTQINEDLYEIIFSGLIFFRAELVSVAGLCLLAETLITKPPLSKLCGSDSKSSSLPDWLTDSDL
jgi:hypothetical protein